MAEQKELTGEDRTKALNQAYGAATNRLRDQHRDEFEGLYKQEAADRGVTYTPRLTAEQKAAKQLEDLLAQYPNLRDQVAAPQADGSAVGAGTGTAG